MLNSPMELELPLGDANAGELAHRRLAHLAQIPGVNSAALLRLTRAFPSLARIYAASDAELSRAVGAETAAKVRWFLDAPLATGAVTIPSPRPRKT